MINRIVSVAAVAAAFGLASPACAETEIQWWHAMTGELGQKIEQLAAVFNGAQKDYKVVAVYKGSYPEVMTGAVAAFRAKQPPHIVQVFEVGTATMMAAKGAVYPVYQLMKDAGEAFDPTAYLPAVVGYYTDIGGNLLSFPFNSSTPILYYNKDLFRKAGLDPDAPPKTWPQLEAAALELKGSGVPCGFTTEWPSWTQIENLSAWHNVPIATRANGFGGLDAELEINGALPVKHIGQLAQWQKSKIFDYGGRGDSAKPKFYSGECGAYLSLPEVQAWWHQQTGYLPITQAAYERSRNEGFYAKNPGTDVSIRQMTLNPPTENSKGLRLGGFVQIRNIIEEEIEGALQGKNSAKDALDSAVLRGNDLLRQFEKANM